MTRNRTIGFIYVDNVIDLITNSSSELFTIRATMAQSLMEKLVADAMDVYYDFKIMRLENSNGPNEEEWQLEDALSIFAPEDREEIKEKYLGKAKYYAVIVDRDLGYHTNYLHHKKLEELGFELISSDY
jgi:hypothetical protein